MERKIDWDLVNTSCFLGKLAELLVDPSFPPPSCWNEQDVEGWSLVHYCLLGYNEKALVMLIKAGCNLNLQTDILSTPVHFACHKYDTTYLQMLCCAGANLRVHTYPRGEPLETAKSRAVKILLANGVRLCNMKRRPHKNKWIQFENGILRCRDVIVTLLGLKKRQHGQALLPKLDRFLIRQELAVAIWSTRSNT